MRIFNKKGQSVAEYSILIALVIGVAIGMQTYIKRGIQGRVRDSSDDLSKSVEKAEGWDDISKAEVILETQYEPEELTRQATSDVLEDKTDYTMTKKGTVSRDITRSSQSTKDDYQKAGYTGPKE